MEYKKIFESYLKGTKIIESCKNEFHIEGAQKYIDQFWRLMDDKSSVEITERMFSYPSDDLRKMKEAYKDMVNLLKEKRKKIP